MREVPLSHSCRQTGWCISGGRTPADRGHDIRRAEGLPVAGAKHPHAVCSRTDCFCLGKFFCSHWRGQGRARVSPCRGGDLASGPVRQTGEGRLEIFLRGRHAGSRRGMSARLRYFSNFFRTACEKKAQSGRCKNIFYDTRLPGSGGQALLPPKAGKSAIARKKILPAVKKT